jgi:uncharacterized protein (TIGR03083 family)
VEIPEHIEALRREGGLLADTAEKTAPDAPVPTCPDWVLRDLVRHIGMVHRWATVYVRDGVTTMLTEDEERDRLLPAPEDDAALVDWYREAHAALVAALGAAPADLACWHFLPAPSPLAFWARRQAHETAIHRVDAQGAAQRATQGAGGGITPLEPAFAVDGVNEMVSGFVLRAARRLLTDPPKSLLLSTTDTGDDWLVRIGTDAVNVAHETGPADCTVRATASDLYLLLWNRRTPDGLDVDGDRSVLAHWREKAQIRWS